MVSESSFFKFLNFIIIFAMISKLNTFEYLPIWESNQIKNKLPNNLLDSEIFDYAIDNKTNEFIYSIYKDNDYYFLVGEKLYQNTYKENLTFFTSPLIDNNGIYYFCSEKYLIKMDTSGNIESLINDNNINYIGTKNFSLKCLYYPTDKIILVAFKNTRYVLLYSLDDSKWITPNVSNLWVDYTIEDINIKNFDSKFFLGIFSKQGVNNKLSIFTSTSFGFFTDSYYVYYKDSTIYPENIFSYGFSNSKLYGFSFSYEPKKLNSYNFYYLDIIENNIKSTGNQYIQLFKESEIYDAYFVENTQILIYVIRKFEKDMNYNYYLGAIDIDNFIILYNIKMDNYKKVFFDFGYLYDNKGFLRIFEEQNEISICPFIYDSKEKKCSLFLNENEFYSVDESTGINKNKIMNDCSNRIKLNIYCLDKCPKGLGLYNKTCILCSTIYQKFLYGSQKCVDYVPSDYENKYNHSGNIYYDCDNPEENIYLKYFDYNCYNNCSEILGQVDKDDNSKCVTCESIHKIYNNDECVDSCDEVGIGLVNMELNGINYSFCKNCSEIGKFYYKGQCYDECPSEELVYESDKICFLCNERYKDKIYNLNGKCIEECGPGYETRIQNGSIDCYYCKDDGKYFVHNKTCQENCEKYSLNHNETNICYYCNETDLEYYQDGKCVNECNFSDAYGLEDYNICMKCSENKIDEKRNKYKEGKCVSTCGTYVNNEGICEPCENNKFFFEYDCYEKCPNYTVEMGDGQYCQYCHGKFQDGHCVEECSKGYVVNKTKIIEKNIDIEICLTCDSFNNTWFNGIDCVAYCPNTKYASEDNFCRLCFCGFSTYNCNKTSDKCICKNSDVKGEIFGDNCEFFTNIKRTDLKILSIVPHAPIISSKKAIFSYNLKDYNNENYIHLIRWRVFVDESEVTDMQYFAAGVNEKTFIVNSGVFQPGEIYNEITLEISVIDKLNLTKIINLKDSLNISIQSINQKKDIFLDSVEGINTVMNNTFSLNADNLAGIEEYKFYYRFLIQDEHNEIIPIKQRKDLDPLLDKQNKKINFMLPKFKSFLFEISNIREEKYILTNIKKINQNSNMEYKLEDILNDSFSPIITSYNDIEIIFLIMKYLDLNKNNDLNISMKEYEQLFKFIDNKLELVANENGTYQSPEPEEKENTIQKTSRYYINYYEPKTIFSLINKLFLNQEIKIPNDFFSKIINIFKGFLDNLIKNNRKNKLDSSNILSFFRTFDHFIEIFVKKQKLDNNYIFNKTDVLETLNKLIVYLISEVYPGETIRIVGKKISLFLSRFGEYQNYLSFGPTNNISEKLKYDDYNTFTYYDYNINQEQCDEDGNTLLCIENEHYEQFKGNLSDIQNYCLSLISINNDNDKYSQNENEGNTFKLNIINYYNTKDKCNNVSLFYKLEFPFYYVPSSPKNYQNLLIQEIENTQRDYGNITCIPKNNLYNNDYYCLTYFNYDTNIIQCTCNILDEITYVSDYKIAKFYKEIQTKGKFKTYNYFNIFSIYIFFGLLAIILIPNFFYLIYEIKNDIKKAKYKLLSYTEKIKDSYLQVKSLNNTSICSFSILAFIYKFPYFSPLRNCNLQTPKYIKHFIVILSIAYGIGINLLLFLIYYPFKERQEIIDKRDIKNKNFKLSGKDIYLKYLNRSIVFSFFGFITSVILYFIFSKLLSFNADEKKYWKQMKTFFSNYVNNKIKREVLLGTTWNKVKLRIIAYYNLCGNYILNKKLKKRNKINKNFENYLTTSQARSRDTEEILLPLYGEGEMTELKDKKNQKGKYRAPSINEQKENTKNNYFSVGAINDSREVSLNANSIVKIVHADNFQLYSSRIKADKSIEKNKKFERIKNKYIYKKTIKTSIDEEIDSGSRSCSFDYINYNKELEIQYENNISFLSIEEYFISESIKKKQTKKGKSSTVSITSTLNPEGFWPIIITSFLLTTLLLILIIELFICIKLFLNEFGSFIINIWLGSSIFIYLLAYPILYYIKIFIGSFLLFKYYYIKNRLIGKIFYWLFVDKTMIYIFKARNYITKYKKEFDY